jgi:hypothetical protein
MIQCSVFLGRNQLSDGNHIQFGKSWNEENGQKTGI